MTERVSTVVIGASAAGLSTACCLSRAGVGHVVLEKEQEVGAAWRRHYERLHLHTTKALSTLPHHRWRADVAAYPPRLEVVRYLEEYAAQLDPKPRFGRQVRRVEHTPDGWRTETADETFLSANVVVATGYTRVPHVPRWPGEDEYRGPRVHSSQYVNGDAWKGQRVLVVGFGNSACEIAIDLDERGARPTMAVRGGVNIVPRDILGVPILGIGITMSLLPPAIADLLAWPLVRATIGDVRELGFEKLPYGPNVQIQKHGRIPLLDIGTVARLRSGAIAARPGVERFTQSGVVFTDGRREDFAAVVLGTGYRPAVADFLGDAQAVCSSDGTPKKSGVEVQPGLYFCGFYVSPTGMFRAIASEARAIAAAIAAQRGRSRRGS